MVRNYLMSVALTLVLFLIYVVAIVFTGRNSTTEGTLSVAATILFSQFEFNRQGDYNHSYTYHTIHTTHLAVSVTLTLSVHNYPF